VKKQILTIFFVCITIVLFTQQNVEINSAKRNISNHTSEEDYIKTCFFIADNYMDEELYDSSQIWLNKLNEKLPAKTNSLNNYLLTTRQAEVYYYNNLQQLGLQESKRGLEMAKVLKDSFLLADSYNFLGLFLMNMDSANKAISYFKEGILYAKELPYPEKYMSLTKPHHLYGNLAEAYYKIKDYNSALTNYTISKEKANAIKLERGVAVANFGIGEVYLAMLKPDSATLYYKNAIIISTVSKDVDVTLICYSGLAKSHYEKGNYSDADFTLKTGIVHLKQNPTINKFYSLLFLSDAYKIYKKQQNTLATIEVLELKSAIESQNVNGTNTQMQTILNAGMANEKKLLNLQIEEAERKQQLANTRLLMTFLGIGLMGIAFLVYRYFQRQKQKVYKIRQNISQDLHDDIGATLSSISIYGELAQHVWHTEPQKSMAMIEKMSIQSKDLMQRMNDIVWSLKTTDNNNEGFAKRILNYTQELLSVKDIYTTFQIEEQIAKRIVNPEVLKNLLLIAKEAINNIAKYSEATQVLISLKSDKDKLHFIIKDNGVGFDLKNEKMGNGLANMQKRAALLKGKLEIIAHAQEGVSIILKIPTVIIGY
jgi:signal transduction histidine kinase